MNAKPLLLAFALLAPAAQAATLLEYDVEGRCETDFERMVFDGLHARIDNGTARRAATCRPSSTTASS
jgi:hypothetical protein